MSTIFYGINAGAEESAAAVSATTTGKDVEVAINTAANVPSRDALRVALQRLQNVIDAQPFPPV
jgi:hypothetical protein